MSRQPTQDNLSNRIKELPKSSPSSRRRQQRREPSNRRQGSKGTARRTTSTHSKSVDSSSVEKLTLVSASDREKSTALEKRNSRSYPGPLTLLVLYPIRLLIFGVGIAAIAGTALNVYDPTNPNNPIRSLSAETEQSSQPKKIVEHFKKKNSPSHLSLGKELTSLKAKLQDLATKYPQLQPGAFFVDIDNGAYVNFNGETTFSAASTIKIPVLVAFFEDVDAGKIYLDEMLTMEKELIAGGSGAMQYQKPGKKFTALETATKMIVISDNTATNMLIARLGGKEALNQRFRDWGLKVTVIRNPLPDLEGTNTTSPRDLSHLLARVNQGELVSLRSRDRLLVIMRQTRTKTLLPKGLEKDAIIAHKTGDIGSVLGDAGIVDMPNGKRYIGAAMVKRPHNDYSARTLIQQISRAAYQHFKWYLPRPFAKKEVKSGE